MTDQTKTIIQVTYALTGSYDQGYHIERTEHGGLTIHERLACLFSDVRTLHKALIHAAVSTDRVKPHDAELDASTVILQLVARTLQLGEDSAQLELAVSEDLEPLMH